MDVLITGGSGFVGSHLVARLVRSGHRVRVLARDRQRLERAMAPHGTLPADIVVGDVLDAETVRDAAAGCDAALHAANVYSLDVRRRDEMVRTNIEGTRVVLREAVDAGCDPVVHVSSMTALLPSSEPIGDDPPIGNNERTPYIGSKVGAEQLARRLQEAGAPVTISYPGAVIGPQDPGPGAMLHILGGMLGVLHAFGLGRHASFSVADVRWLADAHVGLLDAGHAPRRVTMAGVHVAVPEFYALLRSLTGRRLRTLLPSPRWATLASARLADALRLRAGFRLPMAYEQVWPLYGWPPTADRHALDLAGEPPPLAETVGDAIRWLTAAGHLPARRAGVLARTPEERHPAASSTG
jgi:dihydroflavonol-4-reductase